MKTRLSVRVAIAFLCLTALLTAQIAPAVAAAPPVVLPPGEASYYGHTYSEWSAQWWQWAFDSGFKPPVTDETGERCADSQNQSVWFLAGTLFPKKGTAVVMRTCTIPANTPLFFPVVNAAYLITSQTHNENTTSARQNIGNYIDKVLRKSVLRVEVDDLVIEHEPLIQYRVASPVFKLPLSGNLYDSVADGIYILLAPLDPGPHTIHFSVIEGMDVTYHLTVQDPSVAPADASDASGTQNNLYLPAIDR